MQTPIQLIATSILVFFCASCDQNIPTVSLNSYAFDHGYSNLFSTTTELTFQINDPSESFLHIELRSPLAVDSVTLFDPTGQIVTKRVGEEVATQKREEIHHPSYGDQIQFPRLYDPISGMWRVVLKHSPVFTLVKTRIFLSLTERYNIILRSYRQNVNAGMPIILQLIASDYGHHISGLSPTIEVRHQGNIVDLVPVYASSVSESVIAYSKSTSEYLVIYTTEFPGDYQFTIRQAFAGKQGEIVKEAVLDLKVGPRLVSIGEISVRVEEHELSCRTKIIFQQSITVYEPGYYTIRIWIEGAKEPLRLANGRQMTAGTTTLEATLTIDEAIKGLGNGVMSTTNRSDILLTGNGEVKVVAEVGPMAISPSIEIPETCQKDYL